MIRSKSYFVFLMMFFAGIGGMLYGYDIGIITGALLFMRKSIALTADEISLIVASVLGGGALATLITGPLCDWLGRKRLIITAAIIFTVGVLILVDAHHFNAVLEGRLIQGIGAGIIAITIPMYLSESLPPKVRGRGVTAFQLMLTAGILLATIVDVLFSYTGNWRGMFLTAIIPAVILFIGMLFLPESPRWLALKGKYEAAQQILNKSRDTEASQLEFIKMKQTNHADKLHNFIYTLCTEKRFYIPLLIVIAVAVLNQLTGINSILQFSATILQSVGLSTSTTALFGSTLITGVNFIVTLIAMSLVDRVGRKPLLMIGTFGMTIALIATGCFNYFMPYNTLKGFLVLGGIVAYIISFAIGPGVVVWLVLSELLPSRIRSWGMAIALFLNQLVSALFAGCFLPLVDHIGYSGIFWICGFCMIFYFWISKSLLPETKNLTLEEIEAEFAQPRETATLINKVPITESHV